MAGNLSVETCGNIFATTERHASSNYGIGTDGRVGMYVEEKNRAWTSSSSENDDQAITIEVSNDEIGGNWHVSDTALNKLIELCIDICKRNAIKKLNFTGDTSGNLTMHKWFAATSCPGPYLGSKFPYISDEVNKGLTESSEKPSTGVLYRVQTGAFTVKSNADALVAKLKAKGFDTYIVQIDGYYKVQVGAYSVKANADAMMTKLKAAGYDAFITTNSETAPSPIPVATIKVGSNVKVKRGAKSYTGGGVASWIYNNVYVVDELNGDRVVLDKNGICTPFKISDLILQ